MGHNRRSGADISHTTADGNARRVRHCQILVTIQISAPKTMTTLDGGINGALERVLSRPAEHGVGHGRCSASPFFNNDVVEVCCTSA